MVKSPLRYPGGKSRGIPFLAPFIPSCSTFREVFFGGGSVSFHAVQHHLASHYEASDLNYELYCFWSQLKENGAQLIHQIQQLFDRYKTEKWGKPLFDMLVARRNSDLTELERATDFFVLNRITFSGVVDSGGYSQGSFEGRFTQSAIDRLQKTIPVIQPIHFFCEDYTYLVNKTGENVFIFLDPPYYTATKSKLYGKKGILHTSFDHQQLFETLKDCPHNWLVTYDNSAFIKDLYKDFFQWEWQLQYGMTTRQNAAFPLGNELLIANYDLQAAKTAYVPPVTKAIV